MDRIKVIEKKTQNNPICFCSVFAYNCTCWSSVKSHSMEEILAWLLRFDFMTNMWLR